MVFFTLNFFVWGVKSSGAVPFGTMFALLVLWFGISVPLVFLGSYFGYRRKSSDLPVRINQIPRQVPEQVCETVTDEVCVDEAQCTTETQCQDVSRTVTEQQCTTQVRTL